LIWSSAAFRTDVMKLHGKLVSVEQVSRRDRDWRCALIECDDHNVRRSEFEADLNAKHWVIQLRSRVTDRLVGFSTQVLLRVEVAGVPVQALYSGDTIVDRQHWGDPALAHVWGNFSLQLIERYKQQPLVWFLTSK